MSPANDPAPRRLVTGAIALLVLAVAAPARATETFFQLEIPVGGFYGVAGTAHSGGFVPGIYAGGLTWFGNDPIVGLRYGGSVDAGLLVAPSGIKGTSMFAGSIGPAFLLSGDAERWGGVLSVGWAPRMMLDFSKDYVGSLGGVEVAMAYKAIRFPVWYLHTLASSTGPAGDFVGFGVSLDIPRLAR